MFDDQVHPGTPLSKRAARYNMTIDNPTVTRPSRIILLLKDEKYSLGT